jgi:hypothetical protein
LVAPPSPVCCFSNELVPSLPQIARIFSAPPGCLEIHFVKSKTLSYTILQQLEAESCFFTSATVNSVKLLLVLVLGVEDADADADFVGVGLFDATTVALGVGVVLIAFPLFQISFLPDLTQKYLTPLVVLVDPTLAHLVPAIVAACDGREKADRNTATNRTLEHALVFMR